MTLRYLYDVVFDTGNGVHCPHIKVATTDHCGDNVISLARVAADNNPPGGFADKDWAVAPLKTVEFLGRVSTD